MLRAGVMRGGAAARPAGFGDGMILLLLNPKAYVIIALMFSQFLPQSAGGQVALVMAITTVFTLNNMAAFFLWTLLGDRLAARFADGAQARRLNALFGLMLAAVALWMVVG